MLVEEKSESEGIEDDKPRCPFCDHILTKEMTPSGLKYLCIKHGYFDLDDLEGKKRGI